MWSWKEIIRVAFIINILYGSLFFWFHAPDIFGIDKCQEVEVSK